MTIKQIITQLTESGHNITFRIRTDGGIIVKSINGRKTGITEGNRIVREMIGEEGTLSEKRRVQTSYNVEKKIKKESLSKEFKRQIAKVQRGTRLRHNKATIKTSQVRYHIKTEGEEEAFNYLKRREKYFEGYAYDENVESLAKRVERLAIDTSISKEDKRELKKLAKDIRAKKGELLEKDMEQAHHLCYDGSKSIQERIQELRRLLKL